MLDFYDLFPPADRVTDYLAYGLSIRHQSHKSGQTVDFFLSRNRDVNAAKSFLRSAMTNTRVPTKITLDAYAASHRAVREMKEDGELPGRVKIRSSQYLNNLVEQDHRNLAASATTAPRLSRQIRRARPMLPAALRQAASPGVS